MENPSFASQGFVAALASLCAGLLASVEDRLELLSLELHEEKLRFIQIFVWISLAAFTGMMAIAFASLTVVYLFWKTARLAVLDGFALFYSAALAVIAIAITFRRHLTRQPKPSAATLEELKEDRAYIRPEN
jgi:uncharacterized membrane protein YqjE